MEGEKVTRGEEVGAEEEAGDVGAVTGGAGECVAIASFLLTV